MVSRGPLISFDSLPASLSDGRATTRRRALLEGGGCSLLGLSWPGMLAAEKSNPTTDAAGFGQAKSCVLIFLWGGPSQQDTWDMKPDAPSSLRSEFQPIATRVPGIDIGEHLPHMARCHQPADDRPQHDPPRLRTRFGGLRRPDRTRSSPPGTNTPVRPRTFPPTERWFRDGAQNPQPRVSRFHHPGPGSCTRATPPHPRAERRVPGPDLQTPFRIAADPGADNFRVSSLNSPAELPTDRLRQRHKLLQSFDRDSQGVESVRQVTGIDSLYQRAFGLLGSPAPGPPSGWNRPDSLRDLYGRHRFGQTLLLSRRLVEVGFPLITSTGPSRTVTSGTLTPRTTRG
ncbi:MAG: hypothetical protein Ct9H300mP1_22290 [Planctomycetaceae bacterium]|nr:MAG: hypothetical protein Ct9H300mP1_22290 [Planctomycetaceae bacterium]